jgi:hypothetical protein
LQQGRPGRERRLQQGRPGRGSGLQEDELYQEPGLQQGRPGRGPRLQQGRPGQEPELHENRVPQWVPFDEDDEALIGVFLDEIEQEERSEVRAVPHVDYYASSPVYASIWRATEDAVKGIPQYSVDYRHILGRADRTCTHCGALHWIEERKAGTAQRSPEFTCCVNGSVSVPRPPNYPPELMLLLTDCTPNSDPPRRTRRCETFHNSIRHYNNAFSFCSLGAQVDQHLAQQLNGAYTFRAHGALYHRIGSLLPDGDQPPAFAQLYIYDAEEEQSLQRARAFQNLDPAISLIIQRVLTTTNPFIQFFHTNADRIRNSSAVAVSLSMVETVRQDPRVYNRPTASEVAALIPTANDGQYGLRQITLERGEPPRTPLKNL